ncbi:hypothetical protein AJ79_10356 [Helicocarpus griseus UAMH5409]|uniref:Uncharacterized protein n=1 Tax=Helicocarpus griseus UAMH5409 TaxID=1447875 RepID=A0A2B7WEA3_9EURO|nr:hypothetical protein AJ79_10356 [Helicocarpus griseus UAMH5409]
MKENQNQEKEKVKIENEKIMEKEEGPEVKRKRSFDGNDLEHQKQKIKLESVSEDALLEEL